MVSFFRPGTVGCSSMLKRVFRRLPPGRGLETEILLVVIREFLVGDFLAVHFQDDARLAGIRVVAAIDLQVELHAITAGKFVLERGRDVGGFGEHELALAPLGAGVLAGEVVALHHVRMRLARHQRHRVLDDGLRGRDVLLHEHGRSGERIADVVEAEARVIGRKFMVGVVVDVEQVLHRVAVFDAIQPAHGHAAWIRMRGVEVEHIALDPAFERGLFGRRTDAGCLPRA